jgi:hypothetical protein
MLRALNRFLDEYRVSHLWVQVSPVKVYLRKGPVVINGGLHTAVTLANVSVNDLSHRMGYFSVVLKWMEGLNGRRVGESPITAIYVENVFSERLLAILIRHGWHPAGDQDFPSFYKIL